VPQCTVDDLVEELGLPRIGFVKIDVEGYETQVLEGAARTIRASRPVLAVAAYHRPEQAAEIARLIEAISPGYRVSVFRAAPGTDLVCHGVPIGLAG
jgi:hypothetical protein